MVINLVTLCVIARSVAFHPAQWQEAVICLCQTLPGQRLGTVSKRESSHQPLWRLRWASCFVSTAACLRHFVSGLFPSCQESMYLRMQTLLFPTFKGSLFITLQCLSHPNMLAGLDSGMAKPVLSFQGPLAPAALCLTQSPCGFLCLLSSPRPGLIPSLRTLVSWEILLYLSVAPPMASPWPLFCGKLVQTFMAHLTLYVMVSVTWMMYYWCLSSSSVGF